MELSCIYRHRFSPEDRQGKDAIWHVLCQYFFQKYLPDKAVVLDVGAGFCEFLRHIECQERIAVDLNEDVEQFAPQGTKILHLPAHRLDVIPENTIDIVFASNFFEHLPDKEIFMATLLEIRRVLRSGGKLLILQPNIRFLNGSYWDFVDHHLPLTDRTIVEALTMIDMRVREVIPRFLPYTTRSLLPQHPLLVRLYLMSPIVWRILGKQAWIVGVKP